MTVSAFTEYGYVPLFIAFSLSMAAVGIGLRHLLARGRILTASALAGLSFGGAALTIAWVIPLLIAKWASTAIDLPAQSFSITTFTGRTVSSADLKGHVVVLAFWATWCSPCRQELPELEQAYERYKDSRNVTFYAVDGPWGGDDIAKASAFAAQINVALPLAFDPGGAAKALGVRGFPAVVVLDGQGHVRLFHDGSDASEGLARKVVREVGALQGSRT
jgi:thiol-disulfide isomerase/thioredoxin